MKKFLMMVALAFTTLTMSAQDDSKMSFYAGLGLTNVVGSDADACKSAFAYKIGANYDISLSESFSVIPGVELSDKAFKIDGIDGTIDKYYLSVPVLAAYKFNISDGMKLAVKAGPYFAYGLFGSDIEFYGSNDKINVFDSDGGYDRLDIGVQAGVSLDFSQFTIGVEYSRGLTKLDSDFKQYNEGYNLVIGYKF